ncbi:MAG: flagellar hook-basal body complex protein FliE [Ilumatobacteraceae bacterium]
MASIISSLPSIGSIGTLDSTGGAAKTTAGSGFGDMLAKGLDSVSSSERQADALTAGFAAGGNVQIHELMAATTKANLGMSVLNEIRNKAIEAYQSIINVQV